MLNKFKNCQNQLFFITILFFIIGMINISLSILGFACFIIPFVLFWIHKDKIWCKYYCPRAGVFSRLVGKISLNMKTPKFYTKKRVKIGILIYFGVNMFIMLASTIAVATGKASAMEHVRFFIFFKLPFNLPQLLTLSLPTWLLHLGYRVYSMFLTSITVGIFLGIIYKPRTWCVICPIQTLTSKK